MRISKYKKKISISKHRYGLILGVMILAMAIVLDFFGKNSLPEVHEKNYSVHVYWKNGDAILDDWWRSGEHPLRNDDSAIYIGYVDFFVEIQNCLISQVAIVKIRAQIIPVNHGTEGGIDLAGPAFEKIVTQAARLVRDVEAVRIPSLYSPIPMNANISQRYISWNLLLYRASKCSPVLYSIGALLFFISFAAIISNRIRSMKMRLCPVCGYELSLDQWRCSECGLLVDPERVVFQKSAEGPKAD